jgi:DNA-binding LacI/PurR family transcriptional regulator
VARKAGVGLGTVSRVLNQSPLVSDATRERVLTAIAELNFRPNTSARRLSLGRTLTVAVVVPFFTRPAFVERLRGVESVLARSDYDLVLYNVETPERRDRCFQEVTQPNRADGVLIVSLPPRADDVVYLQQATVPIVLLDANHPSLGGLNRLIVDDVAGSRQAVEHLIGLGHQRIGYICDWLNSPFNFTSSADRLRGYQQALAAAGLLLRPEYCAEGEHGHLEARRLAEAMLALSERPTAIFAASDTQALGVLEAARRAGLRVPADLSVVGYDDIEVSEYLGLTTVRQAMYQSGQQAVNLLLGLLANPDTEPVCRTLSTELIVRQTTAAPTS